MFKNLKFSALKALFLALVPFLVHLKLTLASGFPNIQWPDLSLVFPTLQAKAAAVLVYYELVARLVPSVENNSLFHLLGQVLDALAPNHAVSDSGGLGLHTVEPTVTDLPGAGGTGLAAI